MQHSTILLYRLKKSLKGLGLFYLISFLLSFILSLIISFEISGDISPLFFLVSIKHFIFFSILIGSTEKRDYKLFSQFNVSRKRQFLISCLQLVLLALLITCIHFIINGFLYLGNGISYSFESNVPLLSNPVIGIIALFIITFVFYTFAGSLGLLISFLLMKFPKLFFFTILAAMLVVFYQIFTHLEEGIMINLNPITLWILGETENGVNLLYPISLTFILILINLGISKLITRTISVKVGM